jgi:alpha-tubulin suppressor-like RCC1 family protein
MKFISQLICLFLIILIFNGYISNTNKENDLFLLINNEMINENNIPEINQYEIQSNRNNNFVNSTTIAAGIFHKLIINPDGTVSTNASNERGEGDVNDWYNIISVDVAWHSVGLRADGTVVATGNFYDNRSETCNWQDITAISAGWFITAGLKSDGTVVTVGVGSEKFDLSVFEDIIMISAGREHLVGLKVDGTVVANGENRLNQCDVSSWHDIIAVSAGDYHTLGLKADGTVVATGSNRAGQCDVSDWYNIIAISAGGVHSVGLKSDGTVVAIGMEGFFDDYEEGGINTNYNQCDVSHWKDIIMISAGMYSTIGLKSDGTIVTAGSFSGWHY